MKFIITVFYLLFLSNIAFAENSLDYMMGKKGTMDLEVECINDQNQKGISGFKNIGNKMFIYDFFDDEDSYSNPKSTTKIFKKKYKDKKINLYMTSVPLSPEYGIGDSYGYIFSILINANNAWEQMNYFVKDSDSKMFKDWMDILNLDGLEHDEQLHGWSEKAYKVISKKLGFGKPFEIIDLETINLDGIYKHENGNPLTYVSNCKKL